MTARDRIVLIVVAVLATCAAGFFLAVKPERDEAATLGDQIAQERTRLETAQASAAAAEQARHRYAADYATVARLGKAIPADDDVASLVYQLEATAEKFDIDFRDVKSSSPGGAAAPAAATPAEQVAQANADDPSGAKDGEGAQDAAPATQAAAAAVPAGTAIGAAGLPTLPFTFTFDGSFTNMRRFLAALDDLTVARKNGLVIRGRLLTLDGVSIKEGLGGFPDVSAEVKATAYLVPADQGATAGATPAGPAGTTPAPGASTPAAPTAMTGGMR